MNSGKIDFMNKIDKKDSIKVLILYKDISSIILKKLKKGVLIQDENYLKLIIKKIKSKNTILTDRTKEILINIFENEIKNPIIINKESNIYINSLKKINKKFGNIEKNNIKIKVTNINDENYLLNIMNKIMLFLKNTKLNKKEKDSLIFDFFISKGFIEIQLKIIIIETTITLLDRIIVFMKDISKYEKKINIF
jgi:hypothetical protein